MFSNKTKELSTISTISNIITTTFDKNHPIQDNNNPKHINLTLYSYPRALENFPIDEDANYYITFRNKEYKFTHIVYRLSNYLMKILKDKKDTNEAIVIPNEICKSEQAFDLVMKLLYGLENVQINEIEYIPVLLLLEELEVYHKFKSIASAQIINSLNKKSFIEFLDIVSISNSQDLKNEYFNHLTSRKLHDIIPEKLEDFQSITDDLFNKLLIHYYQNRRVIGYKFELKDIEEIDTITRSYYDIKLGYDALNLNREYFVKCIEKFGLGFQDQTLEKIMKALATDEYYQNIHILKAQLFLHKIALHEAESLIPQEQKANQNENNLYILNIMLKIARKYHDLLLDKAEQSKLFVGEYNFSHFKTIIEEEFQIIVENFIKENDKIFKDMPDQDIYNQIKLNGEIIPDLRLKGELEEKIFMNNLLDELNQEKSKENLQLKETCKNLQKENHALKINFYVFIKDQTQKVEELKKNCDEKVEKNQILNENLEKLIKEQTQRIEELNKSNAERVKENQILKVNSEKLIKEHTQKVGELKKSYEEKVKENHILKTNSEKLIKEQTQRIEELKKNCEEKIKENQILKINSEKLIKEQIQKVEELKKRCEEKVRENQSLKANLEKSIKEQTQKIEELKKNCAEKVKEYQALKANFDGFIKEQAQKVEELRRICAEKVKENQILKANFDASIKEQTQKFEELKKSCAEKVKENQTLKTNFDVLIKEQAQKIEELNETCENKAFENIILEINLHEVIKIQAQTIDELKKNYEEKIKENQTLEINLNTLIIEQIQKVDDLKQNYEEKIAALEKKNQFC